MTLLVLIGANDVVAGEAEALGVEVVHVLLPGVAVLPGTRLLHIDYRDAAAFEAFIGSELSGLQPSAVVSLTELGLEPAAAVATRLGIPGVSTAAVHATRDKFQMRQLLHRRAPHVNPLYALADDPLGVATIFAAARAVIAKPRYGAGSADIRLLAAESELAPEWRTAAILLEEFVGGAEYSIECISRQGRHSVVGIAEKGITTGFIECSHLMPPAMLDEAGRVQIEATVEELLDAIGITDGPSHTEVKLDGSQVTVIETHTRLGGDGIAELVHLTTGVNWRRLALGWPIGVQLSPGPAAAGAAATVFFTAPAGVVTEVLPIPELASASIVDWRISVSPGDVVRPLRSSAERLGSATVIAADPERCAAAVAYLTGAHFVLTEPQLVTP